MAILNQKRILNLIPKTSAPVTIHVSQGDVGTEIEFTLVKGDELFVNTGSLSASVHGVREDGANFGVFTCTLSGSSVKFPLHAEMTAVKGSAIAEIVLVDSQGNKVGSSNFGIMVEESVFPLGVTYDNDVSVYESILAYAQTIPAQVQGEIADLENDINSLNGALSQEVTNRNAAISTAVTEEAALRASADTALGARIDNIVAPSGEAPSAEEVTDARVGADGVTYPSLGTAIRTQIEDVTHQAQTVGYSQGATIRNGKIANIGNANAVTIGIFDLCKYREHESFRIKTDRPVDEGYEYYYNYAYTSKSSGSPLYSTVVAIIGNLDTSTRKLSEPFVLNSSYSGVMFEIGQKNGSGEYRPLRVSDFYGYMLAFEPCNDHADYEVRDGSYPNSGNTNLVTAGVFPVTAGKQIRIGTDKPLQIATNHYNFGYYFVSNASNSKEMRPTDFNAYVVAQKAVGANNGVTTDTVLVVPDDAIGLIVTIGEYTSANNEDAIRSGDFKNYNIYVTELDSHIIGAMRDGSYGNTGNTDVVTTRWMPVKAGDKLKISVNRPSDEGYHYTIGVAFSSTYSDGFTYDVSAFNVINYDSSTYKLVENDIIEVPSGAVGVCFTIAEYNGSVYHSLRWYDFYPYYSVIYDVINKNYPDYWDSAVEEAKATINSYLEAGHDVVTFAFVTDTHIGANRKHSVKLIKDVCDSCHIPIVIHGGDAVTGYDVISKSELTQQMLDSYRYFKPIEDNLLQIIGNHEPVYGDSNYDKNLPNGALYHYYMRHNEDNNELHFGETGSYFYIDNHTQKMRYICLNLVEYESQIDSNGSVISGGANKLSTFALGNDQINWLIDVLNNTNGYDVVIATHDPMVYTSDLTSIDPDFAVNPQYVDIDIIYNVLYAFTHKSLFTYTTSLDIGTHSEEYNINADFRNAVGDLICCIAGHLHHDVMVLKGDLNHIVTANDSLTNSNSALTYVPTKTGGTATEQVIDFYCLDKNAKKGYVVRLGAYTETYGKVRQFTWI